jgi:hypothetical protein
VTSLDATTGELVPISHLAAKDVAGYVDDYRAACAAVLGPDDLQTYRDRDGAPKEFIKRSGWRILGVWAMASAEIVEEKYSRDDQGRIQRAYVRVVATTPNGRHMDGIGICDRGERGFTKAEHDIPATAHTRAINRAFADLFGLGAVSAEEMDGRSQGVRVIDPAPASGGASVESDRPERGVVDRPPVLAGPPGQPGPLEDLTARLNALSNERRSAFNRWKRSHKYPALDRCSVEELAACDVELLALEDEQHNDA